MKSILNYARLINYTFWHRINQFTAITESSLGIFRWLFGIFLLSFYIPHLTRISQTPNGFFTPPYLSLANFFQGFPPYLFFLALEIAIAVSILLITLGIKTRVSSYILLLSFFIGNNFKYSFGKIDHDILLLALLTCLIFSNWGTYYALVPDRYIVRFSYLKSLAVFAVLLAFGMFTAGFEKALYWVDFDLSTSGFLSWFYPGFFGAGKTSFFAPIVLQMPQQIFEFADYTAVIFELSAFIALLASRKWWLCWLLLACLFHLANTLLLNIPFIIHFIVYLVFIDYEKIFKAIASRYSFLSFKILKYFLSSLTVCIFIPALWHIVCDRKFKLFGTATLYVVLVLWFLAAIVMTLSLIEESKSRSKPLVKSKVNSLV